MCISLDTIIATGLHRHDSCVRVMGHSMRTAPAIRLPGNRSRTLAAVHVL